MKFRYLHKLDPLRLTMKKAGPGPISVAICKNTVLFFLWYFRGPVNIILNRQSRLAWYELDKHLCLDLALSPKKIFKNYGYGCMTLGPFVRTLERMGGFLSYLDRKGYLNVNITHT